MTLVCGGWIITDSQWATINKMTSTHRVKGYKDWGFRVVRNK